MAEKEKEEKELTTEEKLKGVSDSLKPLAETLLSSRMSSSPAGTVQLAGYQPMQKQPIVASDKRTKLKYKIEKRN